MNAIDPAELSAYLDGELDAGRAAEIENAIAGDSTLQAEFERLQALDVEWTVAARTAMSPPLQRTVIARFDAKVCIGIVLLIALRFLPKGDALFFWSILLHAAVFTAVLVWVVRVARSDGPVTGQSRLLN